MPRFGMTAQVVVGRTPATGVSSKRLPGMISMYRKKPTDRIEWPNWKASKNCVTTPNCSGCLVELDFRRAQGGCRRVYFLHCLSQFCLKVYHLLLKNYICISDPVGSLDMKSVTLIRFRTGVQLRFASQYPTTPIQGVRAFQNQRLHHHSSP